MKNNYLLSSPSVRMVLLALFTLGATTADARDIEQAKQAAMLNMKKHVAMKSPGKGGATVSLDPKFVYSKAKRNGEAYYYVFSAGKNLGYTMVSGDDRMPAIVGYTEKGDFNADNMPDGLADFMESYQNFVDNATDEQINEALAWKAQQKHAKVEPLMTEHWDQSEPYNSLCPEMTVNSRKYRCVTGCVATAMAQILHYWRCPDNLKADIPSYTTDSYSITMKGIWAGTEYDWNNMLDTYTGSETAAQKKAVATLMLHVGCAVMMNYDPQGSGALATAASFTKYFGMDKELVQKKLREDYNIEEWDKMLYNELAAKRPVYYTGSSTGGGHAFVIHGYDDGMYYVNWGWSGYFDGYYDVAILNPGSNVGAGASSSSDGYSANNSMIIGIQPDNGKTDIVETPQPHFLCLALGETSVTNLTVAGNTVTASVECTLANKTNATIEKLVGIGYEKADGSIVNVTEKPATLMLNGMTSNSYYYYKVNNDIKFTAENGKVYSLIAIESKNGTVWEACANRHQGVEIKVENGKASASSIHALAATVALNKESGGYAGMDNTIDVTVTNTSGNEYYDNVSVMVSNQDKMPAAATYTTGVTVPVNGSTTFGFTYKPAAGTYYFWILNAENEQIGKGSITFEAAASPKLSLVSIKCTNATTHTVYAPFGVAAISEVEMNKVADTKAMFEVVIKNDGGYFDGTMTVSGYVNGGYSNLPNNSFKIPGNSEQKFTFTVEGNVGDVVGIRIRSNNNPKLEVMAEPNVHNVKGGTTVSWNNQEMVYLAGTGGDGITDAVNDTDNNCRIYTIGGQYVGTDFDALGHGIYIINGKKVVK